MKTVIAERLTDSPVRAQETAQLLKQNGVDLLIMVYGAFSEDNICTCLAEELKVPIILWAPYEPPFNGERLKSNALVALTMNSASMRRLKNEHHSVYGSKEDPSAAGKIKSIIEAYTVKKKVNGSLFGLFGYRPTGFYNCAFDEGLIRHTFGVRMEETSFKTVYDRMQQQNPAACNADMQETSSQYDDSKLPEGHLKKQSMLYSALGQIYKEQGYSIASIKCWPEMGPVQCTPCYAIGRLMDEGILISCEGDVDAGLTLLIQNAVTGLPCYISDMIQIDDEMNAFVFWHCGAAAPSLLKDKNVALLRDHPLAGQGVSFWGVLKHGEVTIARLCNIDGAYKLFLMSGLAVETEMVTPGTMIKVIVDYPVRDALERILEEGIPHHYCLVWKNNVEQLKLVAKIFGIAVIELIKGP
jgi:L-fucose isomerase-like protein